MTLTVLSAVMVWSITSYNDTNPIANATADPAPTTQEKALGQVVLGDRMPTKGLAEQNAGVEAQLRDQPKGDELEHIADDGEYLVATDAQSPRLDPQSTNGVAAIDPITWSECAQNFDDNVAPYWFKNKYNICRRVQMILNFYSRDPNTGVLTLIGKLTFLLDFIGTGRNAENTIDFRFRMSSFTQEGTIRPDWLFRVQLPCLNADPDRTSTCTTPATNPSFYEMPLGEWRIRSGEEFGLSKTGTTTAVPTGEKYQSELRGFFAFGLQLTFMSELGPDVRVFPDEMFRCDVAQYVAGSRCVFNNVASALQFRLSDTTLNESAAFIRDAQTDITRTRPGIPGKRVPGSVGEIPLHRLYSTYDTGNTYKATRRKVPKTCRRYYGVNYSQNRTKDCDEYPFASTYENAARVDTDTPYDYAVRAISASHNRAAGATYGAWLTADHILDGDPFWVKIVP